MVGLLTAKDLQLDSSRQVGLVLMVAATFAQAGLDVVAKALGSSYSLPQIVWFRYIVHLLIVIAVFGPKLRRSLMSTQVLGLQVLRSTLLVLVTGLFFLALRHIPLAESTAILYVAPLMTVLLAKPILNEPIRWPVFVAAAAGFVGVVIVVQPQSNKFGFATLLPLGAAVALSLYMITTRRIGERDPAPTTWFFTGVVGVAVTSPFIPFVWTQPRSSRDLILLLALGTLGGAGHFMIINAHQRVRASTLAPLGYLELVFVLLIGFLFLDESPTALGLVGIALIIASGIAVLRRSESLSTNEV